VSAPTIEPLGEAALLLRFSDRIDPGSNRRVHALAACLRAHRPEWLRDIVPAYASLALHLDLAAFDRAALDHVAMDQVAMDQAGPDRDTDPLAFAEAWVLQAMENTDAVEAPASTRTIDIPVRYGGADGPDLAALAQHAGLTIAQTVARHCAIEYTVAMLGFAPGFPYLLGLDPALRMPRLATPRTRVPAGSVAIGGAQTGIYPREGPGGWRIIGHTALPLFDALRDPPSLLMPGDRVRFVAHGVVAAGIDGDPIASP
jgi:KipI family sensor histidine kinase inhibitor